MDRDSFGNAQPDKTISREGKKSGGGPSNKTEG